MKNSLVRGGALFFVFGVLANAFNYLYRILMARLLSPLEFGELTASLSFLLILSSFGAPLADMSTRFSAVFKSRKRKGALKRVLVKLFLAACVSSLVILLFGFLAGSFLGLGKRSFYFISFVLPLLLLSSVSKSALSGLCRFLESGVLYAGEGFVRVGLSLFFVLLGFGLSGAFLGYGLAPALGLLATLFFLRDVFKQEGEEKDLDLREHGFLRYGVFSFISLLFLNLLLNADMVLVKRFFSGEQAGVYAGFTTLGRTVFVLSQLLGRILFPVSALRKENGEDYFLPLKIIMGLCLFFSLFSTLLFFAFPGRILNFFLGKRYIVGAGYLGWHGLVMGGLGLLWNLASFEKGVGRFYFLIPLVLGAGVEIGAILLFHAGFGQILAGVGAGVGFALFSSFALTYLFEKREIRV